jgi:DNA (cytosine-5)-methyltransferase 1
MKNLINENRAPRIIVLENVCGTLSSHCGKDFATICSGFQQAGYSVGAFVVDAKLFVPQSRPRLFIVGVQKEVPIPASLIADCPSILWHTSTLKNAFEKLHPKIKKGWIWWKLPSPPKRRANFADLIEENPSTSSWFSAEETHQLLGMMSDINRNKVLEAKRQGRRVIGGVYKRTRPDDNGRKVQRAEIRFDDISGCLRTPAGGSSRQVVVVVDGKSVKARLISSRETARLMGLPDNYILPENYNEAYHLTGDGVVVPVVRHLAENIFEPVLQTIQPKTIVAA